MLAVLFFGAGLGAAASISPVIVDLTSVSKVRSIRFTNTGDDMQIIQAQTLEWRQVDGRDVREPTGRLVVTPRIARIAAGATQIFRVTEKAPAGSFERSYRVVLEDITSSADLKAVPENAIRLRITTDIPVFSASSVTGRAVAVWTRCPAPAGKLCLRLENRGNKRVRISNVRFAESSDTPLQIVDTVLAGSWKQWVVKAPLTSPADQIFYRTENGEATGGITG